MVQDTSELWSFPGGPVVKTLCFKRKYTGSVPGCRAKILHAMQHGMHKNIHIIINTIIWVSYRVCKLYFNKLLKCQLQM